jgi:hypothetical protein
MDQEKKSLGGLLIVILVLVALVISIDWLFVTGLVKANYGGVLFSVKGAFAKLHQKMFLMRFIYVVMLFFTCYLNPSFKKGKNMTENEKTSYQVSAICVSALFMFGYSHVYFYALFIYPILFIVNIFLMVKAVASIKAKFQDPNFFSGVSHEESQDNFYFDFPTDQGHLRIHNPNYHIWVDGGPGSGKSANVVKPIIDQCAERSYAMVIYDFKGDPREPGLPDLCNTAYHSILKYKQFYAQQGIEYKMKFGFINFVDPTRTVRVNVLSNHYIGGFLDIKNLSENLFRNLSKSAKDKADFWSEYGQSYIYGVMFMFWKNYQKEGYNTLPHVITTCLSDITAVFNWLCTDEDLEKIMAPLISAFKAQSMSQVSGGTSTGQLPFAALYEPNIYWVLSAPADEEFNLDITNPNNPCILGIANANKVRAAVTPVLSCVLSVLMNQMNSPGKVPSVYCIDEFPTCPLDGLDTFMATVRSNMVSVLLTVQDFQQAERDCGKQSANILRTTCGNVFQGMTSSPDTAKLFCEWLGDIEKPKISYTENQDHMSQTESLQRERILQPRDVSGQPIGHFMGKIAGGKPAWYSSQFDFVKYNKTDIPRFSLQYKTGNDKTDIEITKRLVIDNFNRINREIKELLVPFAAEVNK